jgi:hypothetical protein
METAGQQHVQTTFFFFFFYENEMKCINNHFFSLKFIRNNGARREQLLFLSDISI